MTPPMSPEELSAAVDEAWPRAQRRWSSFLLLSQPVIGADEPSVARIDLSTRQITLDGAYIAEHDLGSSIEALLAHEIGHHVRYPANLAVHARMVMLERELIPIEGLSLINLFTDLMINERLGHDLEDELCRVYKAYTAEAEGKYNPAFCFYLSIYEELWQRPPGDLIGARYEDFQKAHPAHRADAQLLAQNLFHLGPNPYTQLIYFLSILSRYLDITPDEHAGGKGESPHDCGPGEPTPEDWADALVPGAAEKEAIARALREGWITREQGERLLDEDMLERRIASLPGQGSADASKVPEIMAAYYRREAERFLLQPPPVRLIGEAVVPTTLEEWEPGDAIANIDWRATLIRKGASLGAALPLKRERIADVEGQERPMWRPRTEIYLDVSGSMPDPRVTRNAMTLAAQILVMGTMRAGGSARALLFSHGEVRYWTFCRSEIEMSRFLMHYIGGGTEFPFHALDASIEECRDEQPVRVIITDMDFDRNCQKHKESAALLSRAVARSRPFVLLLHRPDAAAEKRYRELGAEVIRVDELDDFPAMAAALSSALFQRDQQGTHHEAP